MLNVLIAAIAKDSCSPLLFHIWYLDDSALADPKSSLCRVLTLIQELGTPTLGLHIIILGGRYSAEGFKLLSPEMKQSGEPNLDILGVPIGNADFCSAFIMPQLNNSCPVWKRVEQLTHMLPLPSFDLEFAEVL